MRIIKILLAGANNKQISLQLDLPLSTVQRRTRSLISRGIVHSHFHIGIDILGLNSGLIHINLGNGNIDEISKKVYDLDGITMVEIHLGNSDILGHVIYKNGKELLNIIAAIKEMDGIEKVIWFERIYKSPSKESDVLLKHLNKNIHVRPQK